MLTSATLGHLKGSLEAQIPGFWGGIVNGFALFHKKPGMFEILDSIASCFCAPGSNSLRLQQPHPATWLTDPRWSL